MTTGKPMSNIPASPDSADGASPEQGLAVILGDAVGRFSETELALIRKAWHFARRAHRDEMRKSGDPFIIHPEAVARTLAEMGMDCPTVCGALLHDVVENTETTIEDLQADFPDPVPELVGGVTKISTLQFRSTHEEQVENLRKMILAMSRDIRVILIKLADRLHNIRTLEHLSAAKQQRIARSTMDIYAPLAGRLGIYRVKSALEDGAMRFLFPEAYNMLAGKVAARRADRERHIQESIDFLRAELARENIRAEVTGRSKHFWSIYEKMRRKGLTFEEIYDLNALRVICETRQECYEILGVIHAVWKPIPDQFSDYIALPKANMYQSIHTKVVGVHGQATEIQIRTRDMHRVAEEGIAAHWSYKEGQKLNTEVGGKLVWLRQMVDWLQESSDPTNPSELLDDLRREVAEERVFCFTPRGDVIDLAAGAVVLDFAYRIHTDLGHRCTGGRVNGRFVPLRTELKMGDMVEIEASKTPHPSSDWLNIARTSRARAKIRHFLKQRDFEQNVQVGRDMVLKGLAKSGVHMSAPQLDEKLASHVAEFRVKTTEDLYSEVGFGSIPSAPVVARLLPPPPKPPARRKKTGKPSRDAVLVDGLPGALVRIAQCCGPTLSDPIVGLVTRGRGVSVHHRDCPYLDRWIAQSPDNVKRFVPVAWNANGSTLKRVPLRVSCKDRTGVLRDVTEIVSNMGINIVASHSRTNMRSHRAIVRLTVLVGDNEELNALINRLREVPDVKTVTRDSRTK